MVPYLAIPAVAVSSAISALQIVLSVRYTPQMPERMRTTFRSARTLNAWLPRRWGLMLGPILSSSLTGLTVSVGFQPGSGPAVAAFLWGQVLFLAAVRWVYVQNARL